MALFCNSLFDPILDPFWAVLGPSEPRKSHVASDNLFFSEFLLPRSGWWEDYRRGASRILEG